MQVYKRAAFTLVKGLILAVFAPVGAAIVLGFFTDDIRIYIGAGIGLFIVMVLLVIFGENIRFEVDTNGRFRYFKRGKLKDEFDLSRCAVGYRRRTQRGLLGSSQINLQVAELDTGKEYNIDCSPLGSARFDRMFETLEGFAQSGEKAPAAEAAEA